jgi:hypothetical protein
MGEYIVVYEFTGNKRIEGKSNKFYVSYINEDYFNRAINNLFPGDKKTEVRIVKKGVSHEKARDLCSKLD